MGKRLPVGPKLVGAAELYQLSPRMEVSRSLLSSFGMVNPTVLGDYTSQAVGLGSVAYRWEGQRESLFLTVGETV